MRRQSKERRFAATRRWCERTGFSKLLDRLKAGDVLIVTELDRLGRNAMDPRATVDRLAAEGVRIHCLVLLRNRRVELELKLNSSGLSYELQEHLGLSRGRGISL